MDFSLWLHTYPSTINSQYDFGHRAQQRSWEQALECLIKTYNGEQRTCALVGNKHLEIGNENCGNIIFRKSGRKMKSCSGVSFQQSIFKQRSSFTNRCMHRVRTEGVGIIQPLCTCYTNPTYCLPKGGNLSPVKPLNPEASLQELWRMSWITLYIFCQEIPACGRLSSSNPCFSKDKFWRKKTEGELIN